MTSLCQIDRTGGGESVTPETMNRCSHKGISRGASATICATAAALASGVEGRALQPSTLPPPPSPESAAKGMGWLLVGGLAVAAGAIVLPTLLQK